MWSPDLNKVNSSNQPFLHNQNTNKNVGWNMIVIHLNNEHIRPSRIIGVFESSNWHIIFEFGKRNTSLHFPFILRADSRLAPSQRETALLCNDVSHWLGANLESLLFLHRYIDKDNSPGQWAVGAMSHVYKNLKIPFSETEKCNTAAYR